MDTMRELSAGGVVFRRVAGKAEVALISVKGGKVWALPKGQREEGENLARTAHREVKEETGLDGRIIAKIGHVEYFFTFKAEEGTRRVFKIVYFFLMEATGGDITKHDAEVIDVRWFPVDEAIKIMKYDDEKGIIRKAKRLIEETEEGR
ncbi:MAG: NUDIX hydrolase [Deltaproteobacteria bacterium]|nr:NUDIX hydrolase [Deltaproteobacteria bacterium]